MIIHYPADKEKLYLLRSGDIVKFSGVIYTARDAAHKRIQEYQKEGKELPVDFTDSFIYYAGPTPTKPGHVIGSIGPTTSSRMDPYADMMKTLGVIGTIGKGPRSDECTAKYIQNHLLYFVTTGGCGALLSKAVKKAKEIAFLDLGPESIKRLVVEDFTMIAAIDYYGNNLFERK